MVDYLSGINAGPSDEGSRIIVHGVEKVGKTTFATGAPRSLLLPLEIGYKSIMTAKLPNMIETWAQVQEIQQQIKLQVQRGQFPYQTLVWDSATALEKLIHQAVIESDPTWAKGNRKSLTMESALGGYGKAYSRANELFGEFLTENDMLAKYAKINIVVVCHSFPAPVVDPISGEYNCWDLLLHSPKNNKTYGKREMATQWADAVCFMHEPIFVSIKEGEKHGRAMSAGLGRVLGMDRTPAYVAGNRFGVSGVVPIPPPHQSNGWNEFAKAVYSASQGRINIGNHD